MDRRNLSVYKIFFEQLQENSELSQHKDDKFLIYHVSSPYPSKVQAVRDELSVKVYFKSLAPGKTLFLSQEYAFDTLPRLHIGHIPFLEADDHGVSSEPYSMQGRKNVATPKTFEISPEKDFKEFITIDEAWQKYGIYKNLGEIIEDKDENAEIAASLKKEFLASYQVNGRTILIPCIVILQAFYIKSAQNSLTDAMRHPSGLASMVNRWEETTGPEDAKRGASIELSGNSHLDDANMLIYFSQDPDLTRLFNEVAERAREGLPVQAPIPKKDTIKFMAECFITKNCTLVTNILSSDLIDDVTDAFAEVEVLHPKSYRWTTDNPPAAKKPQTGQNTEADDKLDDLGRPGKLDKPLIASSAGMNLESVGNSSFKKKILSMGEREREKNQGPLQNDASGPIPTTTRSPREGSGERKPVENEKPSASSSGIPEVKKIEDGLANMGYRCDTESFEIPLPEGKKTAPLFCYRDKKKTIPRKYHVLKAVATDPEAHSFYFVWLDPQNIDGKVRRKEMFVATVDVEDMEKMVNLVDQELLHQAEKGNRKWFKGQEMDFGFATFRYSDQFKNDPAKTIILETIKLH